MRIRELTAADFEGWLPLWQGYLEFYESSVPDAVTRHTFARLTDGGDRMGGFVAEDDRAEGDGAKGEGAAFQGLVHWLRHPSTWAETDNCYLQDLFVSPAARGAGTGRALIEAVYGRARALGCNEVYWLTQESNVVARRLYDEVADLSGFIHYRKGL